MVRLYYYTKKWVVMLSMSFHWFKTERCSEEEFLLKVVNLFLPRQNERWQQTTCGNTLFRLIL